MKTNKQSISRHLVTRSIRNHQHLAHSLWPRESSQYLRSLEIMQGPLTLDQFPLSVIAIHKELLWHYPGLVIFVSLLFAKLSKMLLGSGKFSFT